MKDVESSGSPFIDSVVKGMTGLAISLIPYAVLKPLASLVYAKDEEPPALDSGERT